MNPINELQTGQVAFLSGLLAGFALSIAVHILRHGMRERLSQIVFMTLLATTLLFLIALYVDVRLTIEVSNIVTLTPQLETLISDTRRIGTTSATAAFILFVVSIGLLGWVAGKGLGVASTLMSLATLTILFILWTDMQSIQALIAR